MVPQTCFPFTVERSSKFQRKLLVYVTDDSYFVSHGWAVTGVTMNNSVPVQKPNYLSSFFPNKTSYGQGVSQDNVYKGEGRMIAQQLSQSLSPAFISSISMMSTQGTHKYLQPLNSPGLNFFLLTPSGFRWQLQKCDFNPYAALKMNYSSTLLHCFYSTSNHSGSLWDHSMPLSHACLSFTRPSFPPHVCTLYFTNSVLSVSSWASILNSLGPHLNRLPYLPCLYVTPF